MPVRVHLDELLDQRGMTLTELAERIGITLANLSILKTNKARAIRFTTLDAICRELSCQPGELLTWLPGRAGAQEAEPDQAGQADGTPANQAPRLLFIDMGTEPVMVSSLLELLLFSVPSLVYMRALRRRGQTSGQARSAVGWRAAGIRMYGIAVAVTAVLLPVTYLALRAVPSAAFGTSSRLHVTYGNATTAGGYLALAVLALAEEILFRGLLAGLLIRRYGFAAGNALQAVVFLAPHLFLLLVSARLWPLLPVQLASGWLLGWLRHKSSSVGPCSLAHIAANVLAPLLIAA